MKSESLSKWETKEKSTSPLLAEYDDLIRTLQTQLDGHRDFHNAFRNDVMKLVVENHDLALQLDSEFRRKIQDTVAGIGTAIAESEMVLNLRKQLELGIEEKSMMAELYQVSMRALEKLDSEIQYRQENCICSFRNKKDFKSTISSLETKIEKIQEQLDLEKALKRDLESDVVVYKTESEKLKMNLETTQDTLGKVKEAEEDHRAELLSLKQEYVILNATLECVITSRNDLESSVEMCNHRIRELERSRNEANQKVEEALEVAEKAVAERDRLLDKEAEMQDEIKKLHSCLDHVIEEAGKKTGAEIEGVRKKYDRAVEELTDKVRALTEQLEVKTQKLKQITAKCDKSEKATSDKLSKEKIKLIRGSETEMTILESQLGTVRHDLELLRKKYEENTANRDKLETSLSQLQREYATLQGERKAERFHFEEEINRFKISLEKRSKDAENAMESVARLENELSQAQSRVLDARDAFLRLKSTCKREELTTQLRTVREANAELIQHVELQMKVDEKWRMKVREIIERFEKRINEVKTEGKKFKFKNKKLKAELISARTKLVLAHKEGQKYSRR